MKKFCKLDDCRKYYLVEIDSTFCKVRRSGSFEKIWQTKLLSLKKFDATLRKITALSADKSNSVIKHDFDEELYKSRNIIERFLIQF